MEQRPPSVSRSDRASPRPAGWRGSVATHACVRRCPVPLRGRAWSSTAHKKAHSVRVGQLIAERAKAAGIDTVVFDRGGYTYGGRIAALADAARENGLSF